MTTKRELNRGCFKEFDVCSKAIDRFFDNATHDHRWWTFCMSDRMPKHDDWHRAKFTYNNLCVDRKYTHVEYWEAVGGMYIYDNFSGYLARHFGNDSLIYFWIEYEVTE